MSDPERSDPPEALPERGRPKFHPVPEWAGPGTRLVHGARRAEKSAGAVVPPIFQTTTFHYPPAFSEADPHDVHMYTRMSNPSHEIPAELVRQLEGAEECRVFASGMGAISTTLLALLNPGDEIVALESLYGGTIDLLTDLLPRYGVRVRWVTDTEAKDPAGVVPKGTRLVYLETPTNPCLTVHDLVGWADVADDAGAFLVVDNTMATPINQQPLVLGADLVLHAATKSLGGHADLMAGVVAGRQELIEHIDRDHQTVGAVLDPFAAFLLARGLRTLQLRVQRQNENGRAVADALAAHAKVEEVHYPGRGDPEQEAIASRQMRGRGGLVSFSLRDGTPASRRFLKELKFVHVASSFGGVESLASVPAETSHRHLSREERERRGIPESLVRLSLGIEQPEDLVRDVREALDAL